MDPLRGLFGDQVAVRDLPDDAMLRFRPEVAEVPVPALLEASRKVSEVLPAIHVNLGVPRQSFEDPSGPGLARSNIKEVGSPAHIATYFDNLLPVRNVTLAHSGGKVVELCPSGASLCRIFRLATGE